jgi:hypothetical protein
MLASGAAYCAVQFVCQLGKNVRFGGARQIQILEPQNGEFRLGAKMCSNLLFFEQKRVKFEGAARI